ncbi:MAG TPA: Na-K-Cl cotransporter, partial [Balneola sp.]|nr:Na-K-Cl cotransporter [Balneola sp.]
LIMRQISYWGDAILIGVWGATLSSALGSILGAPRVLQALARDRVLPKWMNFLGQGSGDDDAPRMGTIVTLVFALAAVYFGDLDLIAPVLTMFFLTTYGVLNITAGIERILGSPSFRPKFKVHWIFSIAGAIGCIAVMFLINATATIIAFIFVLVIYFWLERRELESTWGDVRRGIWMAITRAGLLRIRTEEDPKTWRPNPLVLSGAPTKRWHLIDLASSFTHNRGLLTVSTVITNNQFSVDHQNKIEDNIREFLSKRGIQGLVKVITAEDPFGGGERLVEAYGLGALVPNTIILGDSENEEIRKDYCRMITTFHRLQRNVLIVHDDKQRGFGKKKRIDIWWGGLKGNGGLMMILGYLLQSSRSWYDAEVYLKMVVSSEKGAEDAQKNLTEISQKLRTGAKAQVIVSNGRTFDEILHESSKETDLIFMGMAKPDKNFLTYYGNIQERLKGLPTTILVLAGEEISYGEVLYQQDEFQED